MSNRAELDTVCPNNHNLTLTFSREESESALKSGALGLHCNTCEANWPPSSEDIVRVRKKFAE
jgi:hypothetical protein